MRRAARTTNKRIHSYVIASRAIRANDARNVTHFIMDFRSIIEARVKSVSAMVTRINII
jgi:hypothetical protein